MNVGNLEATNERKEIVREVILRVSSWIKDRKMHDGLLTEDATQGFNLACDFLSHELMKLQEFENQDVLK